MDQRKLDLKLKNFEETYNKFCRLFHRKPSFDHEFWTVVLNIYYGKEYYTGFRYGAIIGTIQFGNTTTSPTWLVVGITLPEYENFALLENS